MEYKGDLSRHYIRNYWDEVGTKFDDRGTQFVAFCTKYNPEIIKYRPYDRNTPLGGASHGRGVCLVMKGLNLITS